MQRVWIVDYVTVALYIICYRVCCLLVQHEYRNISSNNKLVYLIQFDITCFMCFIWISYHIAQECQWIGECEVAVYIYKCAQATDSSMVHFILSHVSVQESLTRGFEQQIRLVCDHLNAPPTLSTIALCFLWSDISGNGWYLLNISIP